MKITEYEPMYKRLSDEEPEDYIWRLYLNVKNGVYDFDITKIGYIINNELDTDFTESKYRKEFEAQYRGYQRAIRDGCTSEEALERIRQERIELEMARKKKQTEAIYVNRALREHAREEMLKERVIDAIAKANKIPPPEFMTLQQSDDTDSEHILFISDIHAYKIFESITNSYSKDILEQRMGYLIGEVQRYVEQNNVESLYIVNAGDDLEGILRPSALAILELGVVDTIIAFRRFIAEWLRSISKFVKIKYIHLISSNHSEYRVLEMRAGQMPKEDFEKDIATYISDILSENERIEVIVPETPYYALHILDQDILLHHGHQIGKPKTYLDSMSRKLKTWFSTLYVGHLHTEDFKTVYEDIEGGDVEICRVPSIIGSCDFADKINVGSKAAALIVRHERGRGRTREQKILLN